MKGLTSTVQMSVLITSQDDRRLSSEAFRYLENARTDRTKMQYHYWIDVPAKVGIMNVALHAEDPDTLYFAIEEYVLSC